MPTSRKTTPTTSATFWLTELVMPVLLLVLVAEVAIQDLRVSDEHRPAGAGRCSMYPGQGRLLLARADSPGCRTRAAVVSPAAGRCSPSTEPRTGRCTCRTRRP